MTTSETDYEKHVQNDSQEHQNPRKLLFNWIIFAITFSLLHATIVNEIGLGSSFFTLELAQDNSAFLYLFYGLAALLLGPGLVSYLGPKKALFFGYVVYVIYDLAFLIGSYLEQNSTAQWGIVLTGGIVGGIGAGVLWMSQGVYLGIASQQYAKAKGIDTNEAASLYAGVFAAILLSGEVILNLITYGILQSYTGDEAKRATEIVYTAIALGSTIVYVFVAKDVQAEEQQEQKAIFSLNRATEGAKISCTDPIINLLGLLPMAFSFMAAFVNGAYNAQVIKNHIGVQYIPIFSLLKPGVATIINLIYTRYRFTKSFTFLGAGSFVAASAMMWIFSIEQLSHTGFIIIILSLFSAGRAAYEGPMKATYIELFAGKKQPAAFSNLVMWNAFPSGLAFLFFNNPTFYKISWTATSAICLVTSILALVSYLFIQKFGISYYKKKQLLNN